MNPSKRPRTEESPPCVVDFDPQSVTGVYITTLPDDKRFHLVSVELDHDAYGEQFYYVSVNITPSGDISDIPGSNRDSCMSIEVIIDCDEDRSASIEQIQYNKLCAFGGMSRGSGTVSMIKSTLLLCKRLFDINVFTLKDHSTYLCESTGETTSLRDHNLFVYGKSWYERNLGAFISDSFFKQGWKSYQERLQENVNDKEIDKLVRRLRSIDHQYSDLIQNTLREFTGKPWNDAFRKLHLRNDCVIFTESFMNILTNHFGIQSVNKWEININDRDRVITRKIFSGDIHFE